MTGANVVAAARTHLGTAWRHQGRMPGVALDCAGLLVVVARQLGLVHQAFDVNGYSRRPDGSMEQLCDEHLVRIAALELGAVLVLQTDKQPQHVGIVGDYWHGVDKFSLIHAADNAGRVIETRLMFARNLVLRGVYRFPGVEAH
jgi:cell wall-associated NlpC family hydrolase